MKQKYTITVADMELNIISDASPDEVESIVGILDRRMREINLKSPRCTKNEAAILCALSYCSERIAMQEAFKKVEKDAFRFAGENEKLKRTIEGMQEEIDRLRKDAAVMRSILDHAAVTAAAEEKKAATQARFVARRVVKEETATEAEAPIPQQAEQLSAFDEIQSENEAPAAVPAAAPVAEEPAKSPEAENTAEKKAQKAPAKSRVGSMFDLLTFSDV